MEETLYFAYGSNINLEQMEHRCPDAQLVGPVTLQNYELQFRGSGFATVSPKKGSVVHGLLWKLTPKSEQALDRYEGYPRHYTKEQVSVRTTDDAAVSVMAYIMAEPMSRQPALPSPYYYRAIQQGFEANRAMQRLSRPNHTKFIPRLPGPPSPAYGHSAWCKAFHHDLAHHKRQSHAGTSRPYTGFSA